MFNCFPGHQKANLRKTVNGYRLIAWKNSLNVKPHRLRREKCSWASDKGNGLPTNVTEAWSPGKFSWWWSTGLQIIILIVCLIHVRKTGDDTRLWRAWHVDPSKITNASIRVNQIAAICLYGASSCPLRPVMSITGSRPRAIRSIRGWMSWLMIMQPFWSINQADNENSELHT